MKRPDRITVVNEVVRLAAATMADKAENLRSRAKFSQSEVTAANLIKEAEAIELAVSVMEDRMGCWA